MFINGQLWSVGRIKENWRKISNSIFDKNPSEYKNEFYTM